MAAHDELAYTSASELATRIRRRDLSPVEVVDAFIARIDERNPSLNAFIFEGFDDARKDAKRAAEAVVSGKELGLLHGVPTAIKDLFDFRPGWPATFGGVGAFKGYIADFWCVYGERMHDAGAILMGKTNSPVMGFRGTCDNPMFGATRNPFDTSRNTGGSSGGGAASVADGLLPLAEGTDGGGSIRIPAAWCNVFGYKASFGRIPCVVRPNAWGNATPFIFEGPLTRSVEDAALALNVLSGYHPDDPYALDEERDFTAALRRPMVGMKVAYSPDFGVYPVDPRVAEVVAVAVRAFEDAGAHVEEVDVDLPFDQHELSDLWCRQIMLLNIDSFENFKLMGIDLLANHRDDFPPQYLQWMEKTRAMSIPELSRDYRMRTAVYDAIQGVLGTHDLLVTPTLATLPVENAKVPGATVGPSEINGVQVDELIGWCMTYFTNFSGHPSASVPAGLADGLPVGMQVIGRRYADEDVLAASAAVERIRPWQQHYQRPAERVLS
jgi:amidase